MAKEELPRRVARGRPNKIPAVLLGKLALTTALQKDERKLGTCLLVDALERVLAATRLVAARLVVIDASDDRAVRYYEHLGLIRTAPEAYRLVRKVSNISS